MTTPMTMEKPAPIVSDLVDPTGDPTFTQLLADALGPDLTDAEADSVLQRALRRVARPNEDDVFPFGSGI
jgi:hypothetical protein